MAKYWRQQVVMAGMSWLGLAALVALVEPSYVADVLWRESYLPLLLLFGLGWFWLLLGISGRWKRGLLWSSSLTALLWLRMMRLDNWTTVGLLVAFNLVWAYYWKISKYENIQE